MPAIRYHPIDGLQIDIESALAEIREIESRRGPDMWRGSSAQVAASLEQEQRLRDAKDYLIRAQALVLQYAKGPTP
jgi:hypothetical protein